VVTVEHRLVTDRRSDGLTHENGIYRVPPKLGPFWKIEKIAISPYSLQWIDLDQFQQKRDLCRPIRKHNEYAVQQCFCTPLQLALRIVFPRLAHAADEAILGHKGWRCGLLPN